MILLDVMGESGINESSGNSYCVLAFHDWRVNMVGECS